MAAPNRTAMAGLIQRSWNGTPIQRRTTDGYVNATSMCKANGKRWKDYRESDRCQLYLDALESVAGISVHALVESRSGGVGGGGTWVHPQVAIDLARWISAPFAVFMDRWFIGEFLDAQSSQVRDTQPEEQSIPALSPQETLDVIERCIDLMDRLGGVDERDQLQLKDMVRNVAARGAGGMLLPPAPEEEELTLSDAWLEVAGSALPRGKGTSIGKILAALYREEFQVDPPTRQQYVDGATRKVNSYRRGWLIDAVRRIWEQMAAQ